MGRGAAAGRKDAGNARSGMARHESQSVTRDALPTPYSHRDASALVDYRDARGRLRIGLTPSPWYGDDPLPPWVAATILVGFSGVFWVGMVTLVRWGLMFAGAGS